MITKKIFLCEDSTEGIFTAIYHAWASKHGHDNIRIQVIEPRSQGVDLELFSEYITIEAEEDKTNKVAKAIREKISEEAFDMVRTASLSVDMEKGDYIYRFLIVGFHIGPKIVEQLGNPSVMNIFKLNRNVSNEAHHFLGFVRFAENKNKILFAKINPKNDVLRLIAPHFSDRLNTEHFVIYDEKRKTGIIHRSGYPWVFIYGEELNIEEFENQSVEEEDFCKLWKTFFDAVSIEERRNLQLQRNNIPNRFRSNMNEFTTP